MHLVAPYVGAWIETRTTGLSVESIKVAPYVGAWIETSRAKLSKNRQRLSHPMWVRGLKPIQGAGIKNPFKSHPMWVRGLKLVHTAIRTCICSRTLCGCVD